MESRPAVLQRYDEQLALLSAHNIDGMIEEEWNVERGTVVHAEILLHDWLENTEGGIRPERFFGRQKFIGTSKPLCKLCSYFFDAYSTDVRTRESSQNVYFNWRMPDIYTHQGEEAVLERRDVMQKIKTRIGRDIGRILEDRLADGRPHDSSAYTMLMARQTADVVPNSSADAITMNLGSLAIDDGPIGNGRTGEVGFEGEEGGEESETEILLYRGRSHSR